jgi:hypothetical protein
VGVLSGADLDPQRSNNLRFTLVEQRLALISERLELLSGRLEQFGTGRPLSGVPRASSSELPAVDSSLPNAVPEQALGSVHLDPNRGMPKEGTLRPPKVPAGLELLDQLDAEADQVHARSGIKARPNRARQLGPTLTGTISGVSLGSLFNLFELERCGGAFVVRYQDQQLELLMREGAVIRCQLNGARVTPVDGVRQAFLWPTSSFSFRRDDVNDEEDAPQSVNSVMLEAMRHNDEAARAL